MGCFEVTFIAETPSGFARHWQRRIFAETPSGAAILLMRELEAAGWVRARISVLRLVSGCADEPPILRRGDLEVPRHVVNP